MVKTGEVSNMDKFPNVLTKKLIFFTAITSTIQELVIISSQSGSPINHRHFCQNLKAHHTKKNSNLIIPFLSSGLVHPYHLDESISSLVVPNGCFSFLWYFA